MYNFKIYTTKYDELGWNFEGGPKDDYSLESRAQVQTSAVISGGTHPTHLAN